MPLLYYFLIILLCVSIVPMKKAIILAAGIGKRLGDLTKDIPKCLLQIDSDNVLLDYSLEALKEHGITEIVFVSGFAESKLKEHIDKKWKNKFQFQFIFNDKYKEYNNIYSAYLAKDVWNDETVLLNSDIIFDPGILRNLYREADSRGVLQYASTSFLIVDDSKTLNPESMKTKIDKAGRIRKINKSLDIKTSFGEYIGITYLKGVERVKFLESLCINVKNKNLDLYYEDALAHILNDVSVYPCSTKGLAWTEVDTKEDYEVAKKIAEKIKKVSIL